MRKKLLLIKLLHTIVWFFFVAAIGYVLYGGIYNKIDVYLFLAVGLVVFEGIILILFRWRCPLTILAYRYTDRRDAAADIFLPEWLAKHNKTIFSIIFIIAVLILLYRIV